MVEKLITSPENVVDFARYQAGRNGSAVAIPARSCRHCGAALSEGEREDECSSAFNVDRLRWQAAQILRGLI
jgi:predicted nucleic acid-binding Zn ribbon protein